MTTASTQNETDLQRGRRLVLRSKLGLLLEAFDSAIKIATDEGGPTRNLIEARGNVWDAQQELRDMPAPQQPQPVNGSQVLEPIK